MSLARLKTNIITLVTFISELSLVLKEIIFIKTFSDYLPFLTQHEKLVLSETLEKVLDESDNKDKEVSKKVLIIPSYYFGSLTLIIDLLFIVHLKNQGANVIIASPTRLFKNQDPLFGGNYNRNRRLRTLFHLLLEQRVANFSGCEFIELEEAPQTAIDRAMLFELSSEELRAYKFEKFPIGEHAWKAAVNLRDGRVCASDENFRLEILDHVINQLKYWHSFEKFLERNELFSILSNSAFYYRWAIPHAILNSKGVKSYSYILAEKMNSILVSSKHNPILSLDSENIEELLENLRDLYQIEFNLVRESYYQIRSGLSYSNLSVSKFSDENAATVLEVLQHPKWKKRIFFPCNVAFDAAVLQGSSAFNSYEEYIKYCIELASKFTDCLFIFKIHPSERIFKSKILSSSEIIEKYQTYDNNNILVIKSEVKLLARDIMNYVDFVVAYSSSMALEAATLGKMVITCSHAHYQALKFLAAVESKQELLSRIEKAINGEVKESSTNSEMSTLYAIYHFGIAQMDLNIFSNPNPDLEARIMPSIDSSTILANKLLNEVAFRILQRHPIHTLSLELKPSGIAKPIFNNSELR
jgi:hypothetical protein